MRVSFDDTASRSAGTASPEEVARFAALAGSWWDPHGKFRPLHRLNPVRIAYIRDCVARHFDRDPLGEKPLRDLTLIDIGCGGGLLTEPMARLGASVTGIDAAEESIRVANLHAREQGLAIEYRTVLPEALAPEGRAFDIVLNMEVVEHVADLDGFLKACATLVKPGGAMVVSTLNRTLKALALAKIGAEYVLRWLPIGTHDWRKFVRPSELTLALGRHGVTVTDVRGMTYNPLFDRWSLSGDLDVNYVAFAVKT